MINKRDQQNEWYRLKFPKSEKGFESTCNQLSNLQTENMMWKLLGRQCNEGNGKQLKISIVQFNWIFCEALYNCFEANIFIYTDIWSEWK